MKKQLISLFMLATIAFSYTNINNSDAEQLIQEDALVIDVRLEEEWIESGIIANSKLFTYFDKYNRPLMKDFLFNTNKAAGSDKSRPIIVVCRSGQRSMVASEALEKSGYKRVYNLQYGILGWIYDKKKLVKYQKQ